MPQSNSGQTVASPRLERQAAVELAKAAALRPSIVGAALEKIGKDPEVEAAMFEILETQKMLENQTGITLLPKDEGGLLGKLLAARS